MATNIRTALIGVGHRLDMKILDQFFLPLYFITGSSYRRKNFGKQHEDYLTIPMYLFVVNVWHCICGMLLGVIFCGYCYEDIAVSLTASNYYVNLCHL